MALALIGIVAVPCVKDFLAYMEDLGCSVFSGAITHKYLAIEADRVIPVEVYIRARGWVGNSRGIS